MARSPYFLSLFLRGLFAANSPAFDRSNIEYDFSQRKFPKIFKIRSRANGRSDDPAELFTVFLPSGMLGRVSFEAIGSKL
jgi:hypothetical protein